MKLHMIKSNNKAVLCSPLSSRRRLGTKWGEKSESESESESECDNGRRVKSERSRKD